MGWRTSCRGWVGMGPARWVQLDAVLMSEATQHRLSCQVQLFRSRRLFFISAHLFVPWALSEAARATSCTFVSPSAR